MSLQNRSPGDQRPSTKPIIGWESDWPFLFPTSTSSPGRLRRLRLPVATCHAPVCSFGILLDATEAVRTSAIQLQYKKKILYCKAALHLCGPLEAERCRWMHQRMRTLCRRTQTRRSGQHRVIIRAEHTFASMQRADVPILLTPNYFRHLFSRNKWKNSNKLIIFNRCIVKSEVKNGMHRHRTCAASSSAPIL